MEAMKAYEEAYGRLNAEQKEAVDTIDGPVMVIAGPGTGKTEVLAVRIANILRRTKTAPERILALTFTESGVVSMRKRLATLLGARAYRVRIATFHSFANEVIQGNPDAFPDIVGSASITDIDQVRTLKGIFDRTEWKCIRPFGDRYYYLTPVMRTIDELKRQGITPERYAELVEAERQEFEKTEDLMYEAGAHKGKMKGKYRDAAKHIDRNRECAEAYAAYEKALREAKGYDWNDMVMKVMGALGTDEGLRLALHDAYDYLLVDEHQDTNDAQGKIVERIVAGSPKPNLFVVGDEKQAIFRFQGASIANFFKFRELYDGVRVISLVGNYRSGQAILDAAHAVSPRETPLESRGNRPIKGAYRAELPSKDAELFFIAKKIREHETQGTPLGEIAVLFRENRDAAGIARALEAEGIPASVESDQNALEDADIANLMKFAQAARSFGSAHTLMDALHADFLGLDPLDIWKLSSHAGKLRMNPYEIMRAEETMRNAGIGSPEKLHAVFGKLSFLKRKIENLPATEAFEHIVRESGFLPKILSAPGAPEKLRKLHAIFDQAKALVERKRNASLEDLFRTLDLMAEHGLSLKSASAERTPGRVRLMTAHKSKGREFDCVFVTNAASGVWDGARRAEHIRLPASVYGALEAAEAELDPDEDGRNLLYVALTRARQALYVTLGKTKRDGKEQLWTKFVAEMREGTLMQAETASYEKEYAERREREFDGKETAMPETEDREFIHELFAQQGLSATALDNYLSCPWKWFYLNLIRLPEAPNKHLMYGNAVHETVRDFFDAWSAGNDRGADGLVARFEQALERQPIGEHDFKEALAKGKKALPAWYAASKASWPRHALTERKVAGIELAPGTVINGKIDKIEVGEDGSACHVVDYKTGKPKSRNAVMGQTESDGSNYHRQLVFYRLLLEREGKYDMISGDIDFIEPDENGVFHKERFAIGKENAAELEQEILRVAEEIRGLGFWETRCADKDCRYCALRAAILDTGKATGTAPKQ